MPKLIQIRETVTSCRECRFAEQIVYGNCACTAIVLQKPEPSTIPAWCPLPDAPEPVERRCGTCKWWKICDYTVEGNSVGGCLVPLAEWIEFSDDCINQMGESDGARCPTWAAKEEG